MTLRKKDIQHTLALLEEYNEKLDVSEDGDMKKSLQNVINVLKSRNFDALVDIQEYYEEILRDAHQSPEQVEKEALALKTKWENLS